jgi:hypothetical protein
MNYNKYQKMVYDFTLIFIFLINIFAISYLINLEPNQNSDEKKENEISKNELSSILFVEDISMLKKI